MRYETSTGTWVETPYEIHQRLLSRLSACNYTLGKVYDEMYDPIDPDARADLLIAAEDLALGAMALAVLAREIAWQESSLPLSEHEPD